MNMSVCESVGLLGVDLGNDGCCVYAYHHKDAHILTYFEDREIPSYVSFYNNERTIGGNAKHLYTTTPEAVARGIKKGLKDIVYEGKFCGKDVQVGGVLACGMLLGKIRQWAQKTLEVKEVRCVIAVPAYFTHDERKLVLEAADIAGLMVDRLLSDTAAACFTYSWELRSERLGVFLDMGHMGMQVAVCRVRGGGGEVLAVEGERDLGGEAFTRLLTQHYYKEFNKKSRGGRRNTPTRGNVEMERAKQRLRLEVEKVKRKVSSSKSRFPLKVDGLPGEVGVTQGEVQTICEDIIHKAKELMKRCLNSAGVTSEEIHFVEATGGSCRIPAIREAIGKVFGRSPSVTVNQSEGIARGCALQCAAMYYTNVKSYFLRDILYHTLELRIDGKCALKLDGSTATPYTKECEVLVANGIRPPTAVVEAWQVPREGKELCIGSWEVYLVVSSLVEVRIDRNGLLDVRGDGVKIVKDFYTIHSFPPKEFKDKEEWYQRMDKEAEDKAVARNNLEKFIYENLNEPKYDSLQPDVLKDILRKIKRGDWDAEMCQVKLEVLEQLVRHSQARHELESFINEKLSDPNTTSDPTKICELQETFNKIKNEDWRTEKYISELQLLKDYYENLRYQQQMCVDPMNEDFSKDLPPSECDTNIQMKESEEYVAQPAEDQAREDLKMFLQQKIDVINPNYLKNILYLIDSMLPEQCRFHLEELQKMYGEVSSTTVPRSRSPSL